MFSQPRTRSAFPSACTQPNGCTRVYYDDTSNRSGKVVKMVSFNNSELNKIIEKWQGTYFQSGVKSKKDNFYHFTFTTMFLGFIDDMEVSIIKCKSNPEMSSVYSNSELRMGSYDFNVNDNRIKNFYEYLVKNIVVANDDRCR